MQGLRSGIRYDTIFLDFVFGMKELEVNRKFKNLKRNGKIYLNDENNYCYDLTLSEYNKATCTFNSKYYNNKLYSLSLMFKSDGYFSNIDLLTMELQIIFMNKYGPPDVRTPSILNNEANNYIWIKGNRKISIQPALDIALIKYEDLSIISKKENESKKKLIQDKKKINNDI
jgi:hypothetical protein